jgi:hypothetical protein
MKIHELKCIEPYFSDMRREQKTFEIRKDDRKFKEGDILLLRDYDQITKKYSGREILCHIVYIIPEGQFEGLAPGYCAMGTEIITTED